MKKKSKIVSLILSSVLFIYFVGGIIYNFTIDDDKRSNKKQDEGIIIREFEYKLFDEIATFNNFSLYFNFIYFTTTKI